MADVNKNSHDLNDLKLTNDSLNHDLVEVLKKVYTQKTITENRNSDRQILCYRENYVLEDCINAGNLKIDCTFESDLDHKLTKFNSVEISYHNSSIVNYFSKETDGRVDSGYYPNLVGLDFNMGDLSVFSSPLNINEISVPQYSFLVNMKSEILEIIRGNK